LGDEFGYVANLNLLSPKLGIPKVVQARGAFGQEDFGSCLLDNPVQAISGQPLRSEPRK
jgi:hypothetical protein